MQQCDASIWANFVTSQLPLKSGFRKWKLVFGRNNFSAIFFSALKIASRAKCSRGVAEDRWTGEREKWSCGNLWNPVAPGGNLWNPVCPRWESMRKEATTLPLAFNIHQQADKGAGVILVQFYLFSLLTQFWRQIRFCLSVISQENSSPFFLFYCFTSFLPVEVVGVASPSSIGPLSILLWPKTKKWQRRLKDNFMRIFVVVTFLLWE